MRGPSQVDGDVMKLAEVLDERHVFARVAIPSKQALLQIAAEKAASSLEMPAPDIVAALERREHLGSTGLGEGVAVPHARLKEVSRPLGLLWTLQTPIAFDSVDAQPVDLVFALLLPATFHAEHLNLLALVARRFRDKPLVAAIRAAPDSRGLQRVFLHDRPGDCGAER